MLLPTDQLLTGTIDFFSDRPVEVTVLMCDPKTDIELFSALAKQLPMDEHPLRGTFVKADLNYKLQHSIDTEAGAVMLCFWQTARPANICAVLMQLPACLLKIMVITE